MFLLVFIPNLCPLLYKGGQRTKGNGARLLFVGVSFVSVGISLPFVGVGISLPFVGVGISLPFIIGFGGVGLLVSRRGNRDVGLRGRGDSCHRDCVVGVATQNNNRSNAQGLRSFAVFSQCTKNCVA
jgi:hypothetical protein